MKRGLLLLAMVGCVSTPPPPKGPKRLSKAKRDQIKARAGANFLDLEKRRKMKTKEERVRDIEENPPNLTTLRPRKETPTPAPVPTTSSLDRRAARGIHRSLFETRREQCQRPRCR